MIAPGTEARPAAVLLPPPVPPLQLVWMDGPSAEVHHYDPSRPHTPCGLLQEMGTTCTAQDVARTFSVRWCTGCFPQVSTVDGHAMMCGCPVPSGAMPEHRAGCWLATVETIAMEAYTSPALDTPGPLGPLTAVLAALCEAGYLRIPETEGGWLTLLDALVDAEVLGPGGEPS